MASIKQKRLEAIIRRDISEIIQFDVKDPNVGLATITDVAVSNDHSYATVYVTFLGGKRDEREGMDALRRASGFIRSELAQRLDIRRTPEILFKVDKAAENGRHIDDLIAQIHAEEESEN